MKCIKKLIVSLIVLVVSLGILSTFKVKADTSFSLKDLSVDEIVNLIFDSCTGVFPKEGQTVEEWADFLTDKLPFINPEAIDAFKKQNWNDDYDLECAFNDNTTGTMDVIASFRIRFGDGVGAKDGTYHWSKSCKYAKYVNVSVKISDDNKADDVCIKIINKLDDYYNTGRITDVDDNIIIYKVNGFWEANPESPSLSLDNTIVSCGRYPNGGTHFNVILIHPDDLNNPTEFSKSIFEMSDSSEIELDDPVIKSLTNKKGKKLVVKYTGGSSFDKKVYKIQVSTNKKFKNAKEVDSKKASATISKLKKGKTYYVRVMYTVTKDGKTTTSNWSKTKSITIKK